MTYLTCETTSSRQNYFEICVALRESNLASIKTTCVRAICAQCNADAETDELLTLQNELIRPCLFLMEDAMIWMMDAKQLKAKLNFVAHTAGPYSSSSRKKDRRPSFL
jgi:hypothetical protein